MYLGCQKLLLSFLEKKSPIVFERCNICLSSLSSLVLQLSFKIAKFIEDFVFHFLLTKINFPSSNFSIGFMLEAFRKKIKQVKL